MISFYFARKRRGDEARWAAIGEEVISSLQQWSLLSSWNFANKLYLLEAEYYFLKENEQKTMACYNASIKAASDHRFYHEEGLAHEKAATYLLHKSNHDAALEYFTNAKKCYEMWGAHALVSRVEKAIAILIPLCSGSG
jgi:hypothetical protein